MITGPDDLHSSKRTTHSPLFLSLSTFKVAHRIVVSLCRRVLQELGHTFSRETKAWAVFPSEARGGERGLAALRTNRSHSAALESSAPNQNSPPNSGLTCRVWAKNLATLLPRPCLTNLLQRTQDCIDVCSQAEKREKKKQKLASENKPRSIPGDCVRVPQIWSTASRASMT